MTPKERAREVWRGIDLWDDGADAIAQAITQAVEENNKEWDKTINIVIKTVQEKERENCAKVAAEKSYSYDSGQDRGWNEATKEIAGAIRARGKS